MAETHVDFDHSLNVALNRLRSSLGDRGKDSPIVETIPRVGCRLPLPAIEAGAVRVTGPAAMLTRIGWYAALAAGAALLALLRVRQHYGKFVDRSAARSHAAGVQHSK